MSEKLRCAFIYMREARGVVYLIFSLVFQHSHLFFLASSSSSSNVRVVQVYTQYTYTSSKKRATTKIHIFIYTNTFTRTYVLYTCKRERLANHPISVPSKIPYFILFSYYFYLLPFILAAGPYFPLWSSFFFFIYLFIRTNSKHNYIIYN